MKSFLVFSLITCLSGSLYAKTFFYDKIKSEVLPLPDLSIDPTSYENNLDKIAAKCEDEDCKTWVQIVRGELWALYDAKKSCKIFKELSDQKTSLIYPIILLKQTEICTLKKSDKDKVVDSIEKYIEAMKPNSWLEAPLRQAQLKLGKKDKILNLAKLLPTKRERETLLIDSLKDPFVSLDEKVKIKKELWRISPRFTPMGLLKVPEDLISAAQDALNANDGALAVKLCQKAMKSGNSDITRKGLEIEKAALKMQQEKKEALKVSQKIFNLDFLNFRKDKSLTNAKTLLTSGLHFARAQWTQHQTKQVRQTLKKLENTLQGKYSLSEIYFLRARLAEEEGDLKQALKFLEIASQEMNPNKEPKVEVTKNLYLWNQGWFYFKSNQIAEASEIFKKIESLETTEPGKKIQAMFWLGKSMQALSLKRDSEKKFRQVIEEDPTSYYAFLSYRELQEKIPAVKIERDDELDAPSSFNLPLFRWLISIGEFKLAQRMLLQELPLKESYVSDWQALFPLYKEAHAFAPVFLKVIKLPQKDKVKMTVKNMDLLYPLVHKELVEKASQTTGLWGEYLNSIIRQESSFDPLAQSPADAIGLMQLLPSIAKVQAKKHDVHFTKKEDLFDPSINIVLGAYHLKEYWENFNGKFILATAGYNASPEAVKTWLSSRSTQDPLVFIEDIPYEETRNYVKLVLRNFINYLRLTTREDNISFPEWCLAL